MSKLRSTCIKCGKKRYRKYMQRSGLYDIKSGLPRWVCKPKCPFQGLKRNNKKNEKQ